MEGNKCDRSGAEGPATVRDRARLVINRSSQQQPETAFCKQERRVESDYTTQLEDFEEEEHVSSHPTAFFPAIIAAGSCVSSLVNCSIQARNSSSNVHQTELGQQKSSSFVDQPQPQLCP